MGDGESIPPGHNRAVVCVPMFHNEVLLGRHITGDLKGFVSPYSTTLLMDESYEAGARRKLAAATGVHVERFEDLGTIETKLMKHYHMRILRVHVGDKHFHNTSEWQNRWYNMDSLPLRDMLPGDRLWVPEVVAGNSVHGSYRHTKGNRGYILPFSDLTAGGRKLKEEK